MGRFLAGAEGGGAPRGALAALDGGSFSLRHCVAPCGRGQVICRAFADGLFFPATAVPPPPPKKRKRKQETRKQNKKAGKMTASFHKFCRQFFLELRPILKPPSFSHTKKNRGKTTPAMRLGYFVEHLPLPHGVVAATSPGWPIVPPGLLRCKATGACACQTFKLFSVVSPTVPFHLLQPPGKNGENTSSSHRLPSKPTGEKK